MPAPQLYVDGLPIFSQEVHIDSLDHSVEMLTATSVSRTMAGTLWVQSIANWKKRRVTITGVGLPSEGFSDHLYAAAVYVADTMTVPGVITAVNQSRDAWGAQDSWSIVLEEA